MNTPTVSYNKDLYKYLCGLDNEKKGYIMCDLEVLGEGAAGTTYTAYVNPRDRYPGQIVLKEQKRNRFCANEFEALKYIRQLMLKDELPGYYIFTYGCFTSGGKKYIMLEKADKNLDNFMADNNLSTTQYMYIFYHVAKAVSHLEALNFNHGDLWNENVMVNWRSDCKDEGSRKFDIKIIDFDSAFKTNSSIKNPSYGGADDYRKKFILGYDLNRFFDSLIYSYESYLEKKSDFKRKKIARAKRLQKRGKKVVIPNEDEPDTDDELFDDENIIYPQQIIDFMYCLDPWDPNVFDDRPEMSGEAVMKLVLEKCEKWGINFENL